MSVATPSANVSPTETPISRVDHVINERIGEAAAALWRAELLRASLQLFTGVVAGIVIWAIVDQWLYSPSPLVRSASLLGGAVAVLAYIFGRLIPLFRTQISSEYAARSLERDLPELRQGLLSYITLRGDLETGNAQSAGLQNGAGLHNGIVRSLGAQTAGRLKSFDQLPSEATGTMNWWFAAIASVVCLLGYAALSPKDTLQSTIRLFSPLASIAAPRRVSIEDVKPGDTEALAGQAVDISATIRGLGHDEVPTIVWRSAIQSADKPQQAELQFDQDTRRYRGLIQVDYTSAGEMQYELVAGDATAGPYRLSIQDVPVIVGISIHYAPPSYTGEKPYTRTGGGITALSGSLVTVTATTNRPVTRAKIEFNPRTLGQSVQATAGSREMQVNEAGTGITLALPLKSVRGRAAAVELESYRIQVWDDAGQSSPNPIVYPIRVIEDLAPNVTIVVPQQTPKDVPIDAQQIIEVHAIDPDYGLKTIELELRRGIDVLANPVLWRDDRGASGNQVTEYRFRPSEHGLRVGDVVSVTAVASDNRSFDEDPSIEPNYSSTDAIQLKITMGEAPEGEPQLNDGLSKKDDSPAADRGEKSQTDEQGGGGGAGGEGGAQSTAKGNSGGQSQSGNSSSKGEGKQDDPSKSDGGKSGSNSPDNEPSEAAEPSEGGDASNGDKPSGGDSSNGNSSNSNPSNSGKSGGGKSGGDSEPGHSNQNNSPENMSPSNGNEPNQSANPNSNSSASPSSDAGRKNGARQDNDAEQDNGAEQDDAAGMSGTGKSAGGNQSQPKSNENSGESSENASDGSNGSNNEDQAPEHDGEAFERIREHLDQKKLDQEKTRQGNESQQDSNPQPDKNAGSEAGKQGSGQNGSGQKGAGDPGAKPSESGESDSPGSEKVKPQSDQGKGDPSEGESAGPSDAGQPNEGMSNDGKPQGGSNQTTGDDNQSGNNPSDQKNPGDQATGEQNGDKQQGGDPKSGSDSGDGSQPANNKPSDGTQPNPKSNPGKSDAAGKSNDSSGNPSQSNQPQSNQPQSTGEGGAGAGTGSDSGSGTVAPQTPVDAPDLEYTKKATDMVLDYLKETRDAPDRELLDKLKWSEDDLRRFSERWQSLRESGDDSPLGENREMKEALESLGMRPRGSATTNRSLQQDDLQGLRDSGARQAPPAALRDAFDAFRRAASRQNP